MLSIFVAVLLQGDITLPGKDPAVLPSELERAAREYRITVYETYRLDRQELERRQTEGRQAILDWRNAGSKTSEARLLMDWLKSATQLSESHGNLPERPTFSPQVAKPAEPEKPKVVKPLTPPTESIVNAEPTPPASKPEKPAAKKPRSILDLPVDDDEPEAPPATVNQDSATPPVSSATQIPATPAATVVSEGNATTGQTAPAPDSATKPTTDGNIFNMSPDADETAPAETPATDYGNAKFSTIFTWKTLRNSVLGN